MKNNGYSYSQIISLSDDEYEERCKKFTTTIQIPTPTNDIKQIEKILDLRAGLLKNDNFTTEQYLCKCGRELTYYDVVFTGLIDAGHDKSFVVHTIVGSKKIVSDSKHVRCSGCGELSLHPLAYKRPGYSCGTG